MEENKVKFKDYSLAKIIVIIINVIAIACMVFVIAKMSIPEKPTIKNPLSNWGADTIVIGKKEIQINFWNLKQAIFGLSPSIIAYGIAYVYKKVKKEKGCAAEEIDSNLRVPYFIIAMITIVWSFMFYWIQSNL